MTAKRKLLLLVGPTAAVAIGIGAALCPPVQTWAAGKAIASGRWPGVSVGRVALRPGRASLEGLRMVSQGGVLTAPEVDADVGLISAWLGRGYHFGRLVARGWVLDLAPAGASAALPADPGGNAPARALAGVLAVFDLPTNLSLDGVELEGDVLISGEGGRPGGRVHVGVSGGGLAAGREGRFLCRATADAADPAAPVASVTANATLSAEMGSTGSFAGAELRADATAVGRGFPGGIGLSLVASASHRAGMRSYSFSLNRGIERIGAVNAENPDGSTTLSGSWRLDLKDSDVAPFALGRSLPAFYVAGGGTFETDAASGDVHLVGKLQASADRLGLLARGLGPLGRVGLAADFDLARLGASLRVARLETTLAGASPVASVRALQSFEFNPATGELKVAVPSGDLVGISVAGLPLSWLGSLWPGLSVSGGDAHGEFVMRAEDGRLALRTKAPLAAEGVAVARNGSALAAGLGLSAFVLADYAPQGWQVQLAPFAVRSDGIKMFTMDARFGRLAGPGRAVKAAGSWSASLGPLLAVPAAADFRGLSGGEASGSFEASLDATREIRVKLLMRDLALSEGGGVLPSVESEMRADIDTGGRSTFSVPLRLDYGGRSAEFAFSGTVASDSRGALVDATLAGSRLAPEDVSALAFLAGGAPAGPGQGGGGAPARAPLWHGLRGRLALKLESVALGRVELSAVRGTLRLESDSLSIEGGTATLDGGGAGRIEGRLDFRPKEAVPLLLKADVSVDGVDAAAFFRAMDPGRAPAIEGRFDVSSHLTSGASRIPDLPGMVQGSLRLSSKDGTFRALRTDIIDQVRQAPSRLVDALDTVGSLFGKKPEKIGQALVATANGLSEIRYDQMSVEVERGTDMDLRITALTLIAPEARLTGTGRVSHAEGVLIQDQPLSVDLNLSVRGATGRFLDTVGLLAEGQDELGYTPLNQPIHLGGTLRAIDQSQWKDMLVQASLRKGGGLFDKLLGR